MSYLTNLPLAEDLPWIIGEIYYSLAQEKKSIPGTIHRLDYYINNHMSQGGRNEDVDFYEQVISFLSKYKVR